MNIDKLERIISAENFHEIYERLAPSFGYDTRAETRKFNPDSPNGKLMIAVCAEIAAAIRREMCAIEHKWEYACVPRCGPNCPAHCIVCNARMLVGQMYQQATSEFIPEEDQS